MYLDGQVRIGPSPRLTVAADNFLDKEHVRPGRELFHPEGLPDQVGVADDDGLRRAEGEPVDGAELLGQPGERHVKSVLRAEGEERAQVGQTPRSRQSVARRVAGLTLEPDAGDVKGRRRNHQVRRHAGLDNQG